MARGDPIGFTRHTKKKSKSKLVNLSCMKRRSKGMMTMGPDRVPKHSNHSKYAPTLIIMEENVSKKMLVSK